MKKIPTRHVLHFANLPREICHILIGKDHHIAHRLVAGGVIMSCGVAIAKYGGHYPDVHILHYLLDMGGYFVHALGAVPYIELLIEEDV